MTELASRLADMIGRALGEHHGIGATAIEAIHRRLAAQPETIAVVDRLARQL